MGAVNETLALSESSSIGLVPPGPVTVSAGGSQVVLICLPCGAFLGFEGDTITSCHPEGEIRRARARDVQFGPDGLAVRAVPLEEPSL